MRYTDPSSLEYDEQLFQELNSFSGDELRRFFNLHHERVDQHPFAPDANFNKDDYRYIVAADLKTEAETLLERYRKLREESVRIGDATQYLSEVTDLSGDGPDVGSLSELLLMLYEQEYTDQLDELIAGIDLRRHRLNRSHYIDARFEPGRVSKDIDAFFEQWQSSQSSTVPVRIEIEAGLDRIAVFREILCVPG